VSVTAGHRVGSQSEVFTVDGVGVSAGRRANTGGSGGVRVTVAGEGWRRYSMSEVARVGRTGCEGSRWTSQTAVLCLSFQTVSGSSRVSLTSFAVSSTVSCVFSFDLVAISSARLLNVGVAASQSITVQSKGLSLISSSEMARVGHTGCEGSRWISQTAVMCLASHSISGTRRVSVTSVIFVGSVTGMVSADVGVMSSALLVNLILPGGETITGLGAGLGFVSRSGSVSVGFTGAEVSDWISDTVISCRSPEGMLRSLRVLLTLGNQASSFTHVFSYDAPIVSDVHSANVQFAGKSFVAIMGSGFCVEDGSLRGQIGNTACENSLWMSETSLLCRASAGNSGSATAIVTNGRMLAAASDCVSYDLPAVSSESMSNVPPAQRTRAFLNGVDLGSIDRSAKVRHGMTNGESSAWISGTSVVSLSPGYRNWGGSKATVLTIGELTDTATNMFSADVNFVITLFGAANAKLGEPSSSVKVGVSKLAEISSVLRVGDTGCHHTKWVSTSSLQGRAFSGPQGTRVLTVTMATVAGSLSSAFTFYAGLASAFKESNIGEPLQKPVLIHGLGLGKWSISSNNRMGHTGCESTVWHSETTVFCRATHSASSSKLVTVTSGPAAGSASSMISVDVGALTQPRCDPDETLALTHGCDSSKCSSLGDDCCAPGLEEATCRDDYLVVYLPQDCKYTCCPPDTEVSSWCFHGYSNLKLPGRQHITVFGSGLSMKGYSGSIRLGGTASENTVWVSESSVICKTAEGQRRTWRVMITTGVSSSSLSEAISFDSPVAIGVRTSNSIPSDQRVVRILGHNLATGDSSIFAQIGETSCEMSNWLSETSLHCRVSIGKAATKSAEVTMVNKWGEVSQAVSFDEVVVSSVCERNLVSAYHKSVSLSGANMGNSDPTLNVRSGNTACELSVWHSDTSMISLTTRHPAGRTKTAVMTMSSQSGSHSSVFSFDGVIVRDLDVLVMPIVDGAVSKGNIAGGALSASLSVFGSDFTITGTARMGYTDCEATVWTSESQLTCRSVKSAHRGSRPIIITGGRVVGSVSAMLSVDGGTLSMIQTSNLKLRRDNYVVVFGPGLVQQNLSPAGRIGMTGAETTRWMADTSVICRNAEGVSRTRRALLTVSQCVSTLSEVASYDTPRISKTANAAQIQDVVVLGLNFVRFDNTQRSRFGKTGCQMSAWVSDTSLKCRAPSGMGQSICASVTLARTVSVDIAGLSYDTCTLTSVSVQNAAKEQGIMVTMAGAGIVSFDPSQTARLSFTACDLSTWMSDSSITAFTPSGMGATLRVSVTAALQPGTFTEVFSLSGPLLELKARLLNVPTYGGVSMHLAAYNYGPLAQSIGIRLGSASESTHWISASSLLTNLASGFGRAYFTSLTSGSQIGSVTNQLSYDVPVVNCITHRYTELEPGTVQNDCKPYEFNRLPFIDASITLHGSRFASVPVSPNAVVGGTSCATTTWISDSSVRCHVMAIGKVGTLPARISIQSLFGEISGVFSSTLPFISSASLSNVRAIGKAIVTMHGINLGPAALTFTIRVGSTQTSATFWVSDTSMSAYPVGGVTHKNMLVCISVMGFASTSRSILSYDVESLIGPLHRYRVNTPHTGSFSISMSGTSFGENTYSQQGRIGNSAGEGSRWTSDTTVSCAKPSGSQNLAGITSVTIHEQTGSMSDSFSVDIPEAKALLHANLPGHVIGRRFTVFGTAMDIQHVSAKMNIGGSNCQATQWLSHTTIACKHSIGTGNVLGLVFTAGLQGKASMSNLFSYDCAFSMMKNRGANRPPGTTKTSVGIVPVKPGFSERDLALSGSNLLISYTGAVKLGFTVATSTLWRAESSVCARVAAGIGANLLSAVTISRQVGCTTNLFTYDASDVTGSAPSNMRQHQAMKVNDAIALFGRDFGMHTSQRIRIGDSQCETSAWVSDTLLTCRRSAGLAGRDLYLTVSFVAHYRNTRQALHSYDNPVVTDAAERLDEDQRQDLITLHGYSFGRSDYSLNAQVEQYGCTATTWLADTSLLCKLRSGFKAHEVQFTSIRSTKICRRCSGNEALIRCGSGSPGYCWVCEPCGPGFFRDCFPSEYVSGECLACQNEGQPIGDRFYKDIVGNAQTQCSPCSLCGGRNQDGTEYEARRCTRDTDTQCAACQSCTGPKIRVGCGGDTEGECTEIAPGVARVFATATARLNGRNLSPYLHETGGKIVMKMTGDYEGTYMVISETTRLAFPGEMTNISISAIEPSGVMMDASKRNDLLEDLYAAEEITIRRLWKVSMRRASSNLTSLSLQMVSNVVHCNAPGLIVSPPAILTLRLDAAAFSQPEYAGKLHVYSWDTETNQWRRIASPGDYFNITNVSVGIRISNFSTFVVMVPVEVETTLSSNDLVMPAVVITVLVLGSVSLLVCWWQRDFILLKAGVRSRERTVNKFHSPSELEVSEYSLPATKSNRSYYSSPSPSSQASRWPILPPAYEENEWNYPHSPRDDDGMVLAGVDVLQVADDYERRIRRSQSPGGLWDMAPPRPIRPEPSPPGTRATPHRTGRSQSRRSSPQTGAHHRDDDRIVLAGVDVLQVADDYERRIRRSQSPGGLWDMAPPRPIRPEPSPPGTWDSPAMHRRSAPGSLAIPRGHVHHMIAFGSDKSAFASSGPSPAIRSLAMMPGSAASRMRQRAGENYLRVPEREVVERDHYSHTVDPRQGRPVYTMDPRPDRPVGARLTRTPIEQGENQYFSASEPESFLNERFETLADDGMSVAPRSSTSQLRHVPGWSYPPDSRGDESEVRHSPSSRGFTGYGTARTSDQQEATASSPARRYSRSAPRTVRGYRTYVYSDSDSDESYQPDDNSGLVALADDHARGAGRGRDRGRGNGGNSESIAREFLC
jgi:hypothetical protein